MINGLRTVTSIDPCGNCGARLDAAIQTCPACGESRALASPLTSMWESIRERLASATAPRYAVKSLLGYGGMAGVYLAEEPRLGRHVAIKVMTPALMADPALVARFEQEARTIAQLKHENIVTIHDVDERDGLYYFVMEHVPGRTLAQVVAERRTEPLPVSIVLHWIGQVASALTYAHSAGVVHRDVKPGNIMLDSRGNALVTDFGIAKVADESGLTRTGFLVGTPAYMSPEQCGAGAVTGASDQYALGIVAYELLAGRPPFSGATMEVVQAHLNQPPPPLMDLRRDCPDHVRTGIERMLAKRPEDRYASVAAASIGIGAQELPDGHADRPVLVDLSGAAGESERSVTQSERMPPPTPPTPVPAQRWLLLVAAGIKRLRAMKGYALLIVVAGTAAAVLLGTPEPAPERAPPVALPPEPGMVDPPPASDSRAPTDTGMAGDTTVAIDPPPGRRTDVPVLGPTEPHKGQIQIAGTLPPGAEVAISGGGALRRTAGGTIQLPAGSYSLEATAPGHDTVRKELRVDAGSRSTWSPALTPLAQFEPDRGPSGSTETGAATDEAEVRAVIDRFIQAVERRDMDAVLRAFPGAVDEWAEDQRAFYENRNVKDLRLRVRPVDTLEVEAGAAARTVFHVDAEFRDTTRRHTLIFEFNASFRHTLNGWTLTELSQNR